MYCACRVLASGDLMPSGAWKVKPSCQVTKLLYIPGLRLEAGARLLIGDDRVQGLERGPGHDGLRAVELLAQAVQLIEGVEVQLRQQLVASDQQLELGDANQDLLLHDVGLEVEHLGEAGVPVGLEPGLGGRGDRNDPPIVGRRQAEDVAQLPLGRDHVRGPRHQVEVELFEPLGGLGDVGDRAAADLQLGLLAIEDLLGQADGPIGAPELNVRLGQVPVLLLDRPARAP